MAGANPNRIKQFRLAKRLTTRQLADAIGASQGAVSRLETGKMKLSLPWLEKIAFALGVRVVDLLDNVGDLTYANVKGRLTDDLAPMFPLERIYTIPVPALTGLPTDTLFDAFESAGGGFIVARRVMTLERSMIGKCFLLLLQAHSGPRVMYEALEFRTLEESTSEPGFSTAVGDPLRRWIGWDSAQILLMWLIVAEWKIR